MTENNKMREMPVYKLMIQMGIPMILSMALQAVYNIGDSAFVGNMKEGSEAEMCIRDRVYAERYEKFKKKYNSIDDGRAASRVLHLMKQLIPSKRIDVYYE